MSAAASNSAQTGTNAFRCAAPSAALYLNPSGLVSACCGSWHVLGTVTGPERRSLRDIWHGARRDLLEGAVRSGDTSLGCWECGQAAAEGHRASSLAAVFDRFTGRHAEYPAILDLALSNRCNLACVMCNGGLSSTIRARREGRPPLPSAYDDRFFDELDEFLPHVRRFQFKGGEPFLASENQRIWRRLVDLDLGPEVCVTTNGTIWSDEVAELVERLRMDVIISVDAVEADRLRSIRSGINPTAFWRNVDRFSEIAARTGAHLELAMCLMAGNWDQLRGLLEVADRRECDLSVIWVDGPARFGLLGLPADELGQVAAAMDAQDSVSAPLRPDLERIWEDVRHRVRSALRAEPAASRPAEPHGTDVAVTLGKRSAADTVDAVRRQLLEESGTAEVAQLRIDHEVFTAVAAPDWSRDLDLDDWVGRGFDETMFLLGRGTRSVVRAGMDSLEGGVHVARVELVTDGGSPRRLLVAYVPPGPGASTGWLLISQRTR